jgi:predicted TIM-barrel fold metal-dependent hydrolase
MAHLSGEDNDHIEAIDKAKHHNVYTDVATVSSIKNRCIEYAVSRIGSDRILFGTDTYAPGSIRGRVEYAPISDTDKINILRDNALRLFADKIQYEN